MENLAVRRIIYLRLLAGESVAAMRASYV